jgi:hypothetical protein
MPDLTKPDNLGNRVLMVDSICAGKYDYGDAGAILEREPVESGPGHFSYRHDVRCLVQRIDMLHWRSSLRGWM